MSDKLHVGCGTCYLVGWQNMDVASPTSFYAHKRPDLVARYSTTEDDYYGRHKDKTIDKLRQGPTSPATIYDVTGTFQEIPFAPNSLDEILARQVFEHFDVTHGREALKESNRTLRKGGILRLDVPDIDETLKMLGKTNDTFYMRHVIGPRQKGDYGYHTMAYTREGLTKLVSEYGFEFVLEEPNIHNYPAFCLRFKKVKNL